MHLPEFIFMEQEEISSVQLRSDVLLQTPSLDIQGAIGSYARLISLHAILNQPRFRKRLHLTTYQILHVVQLDETPYTRYLDPSTMTDARVVFDLQYATRT